MWRVKGKENCECEGVWGEKCGGAGEGRGSSVGVWGGHGEVCVWSVGGWVGGACVCVSIK